MFIGQRLARTFRYGNVVLIIPLLLDIIHFVGIVYKVGGMSSSANYKMRLTSLIIIQDRGVLFCITSGLTLTSCAFS